MPDNADQVIAQYFNLDAADLTAIRDAIGAGRSLGDLLQSVATLEAGGGSNVRYLTGAEVVAARGVWSIVSGSDVVVANNTGVFPVFDTLTGSATHFGIEESSYWASDVPILKTPGIYEINFSAVWPANATGGRHLEINTFYDDGADFLPGNLYADDDGNTPVGYNQHAVTVYVWDDMKPIGLGMVVKQTSGGSLTIAKANIVLVAFKIAEFL